ncbi:MAG TPA: hypothetical protein VJ963_15560 [Bacteroidales bacterium]|nr:hypothetical protein [Bacteroidales bacterium]
MKKILLALLVLTVLISVVISCKRNPYKINTSGINVDIKIKRLEKDLFSLNPDQIISSVPALKAKYGSFLQLFSYVINTGDINENSFGDLLVRFCTDKLNNEVYNATMKVYPDVNSIQNDLDNAFRHYLYYFPMKAVPAVCTCITGFNNSIITGDSVLGISLDRYLGAGCEYYPRLQIYKYMSDRMTPSYIVPDCMYAWASTEWDFSSEGYPADNVLAEMLHEGKLKYFEKCMMPEKPDTLIFGFSPAQMDFCRNNEGQMWQYLVEHKLLFSTDQFTIRKLTGEAPFTTFFSNESPGKATVWIGFRIIESYMSKNRGVELSKLMTDADLQGILQKAKYNPQ